MQDNMEAPERYGMVVCIVADLVLEYLKAEARERAESGSSAIHFRAGECDETNAGHGKRAA